MRGLLLEVAHAFSLERNERIWVCPSAENLPVGTWFPYCLMVDRAPSGRRYKPSHFPVHRGPRLAKKQQDMGLASWPCASLLCELLDSLWCINSLRVELPEFLNEDSSPPHCRPPHWCPVNGNLDQAGLRGGWILGWHFHSPVLHLDFG